MSFSKTYNGTGKKQSCEVYQNLTKFFAVQNYIVLVIHTSPGTVPGG
jgi:hypothetical protein